MIKFIKKISLLFCIIAIMAMSSDSYYTFHGGTIHLIINNHLNF
jgi:hypothetical protein